MKKITEEDIREKLRVVNDPELRINVVDLGLIYQITVSDANDVFIKMTVTTPGCPVIDQFLEQVHQSIENIEDVGEITVKLTFDPLWTPEKMAPQARAALGL